LGIASVLRAHILAAPLVVCATASYAQTQGGDGNLSVGGSVHGNITIKIEKGSRTSRSGVRPSRSAKRMRGSGGAAKHATISRSTDFDGVWAITWSSCRRTETYSLRIQDGVVTLPDRDYKGRISASGNVHWSGSALKYGGYVRYVGKLRGSAGWGRFTNTTGCPGTFTASKQ
jgi:hypothetical protein